ncbi:MAG TPA: hypothetical protein VHG28_08700, partial [Longimicrobiaceae bacterium]|nr:hypothetical protein [Longimicrobiaceae bacterium]
IILNELLALRTADGSRRYYYGLLTHPGGNNIAGIGFIGRPAALGYDAVPGGVGTLAHELGHNFGRLHAPCGNPGDADRAFPYANGGIGVFGYDVPAGVLKDPAREKDLMSYCSPEWISDYTYRAVLQFRLEAEPTVLGGGSADAGEALPEPSLLVWGRVGGGTAVLEPAFEITTRPSLPAEEGPYRIEGLDTGGALLFSLPFGGAPLAEVNPDERQFAFAIPERLAQTDRLARLRLVGPGVRVERRPEDPSADPVAPAATLRRPARGEVRLEWEDGRQPMALVRDAQTGEILSFARDGGAALRTPASRLEVLFSDGVRTTRRTLRIR